MKNSVALLTVGSRQVSSPIVLSPCVASQAVATESRLSQFLMVLMRCLSTLPV
jgi:hypothetical protein